MIFVNFVSFSYANSTENYLPLEISGKTFTFSTENIPEKLSVTVMCTLSKINGQKPKDNSYIFVYPYSSHFSSIVRDSYDGFEPLEIGGKVYKNSSDSRNFSFQINGVSQENRAIVIDTRREGRHALTGYCYY